ncbi:hypothetical protein SDC9_188822 [bioreactor metagenome]|uniref:Uncharacterized protein n=1 Tax=bioreactor metagenome TaxID=1076179 RepID=A0A645HSU5_9ZZZZ
MNGDQNRSGVRGSVGIIAGVADGDLAVVIGSRNEGDIRKVRGGAPVIRDAGGNKRIVACGGGIAVIQLSVGAGGQHEFHVGEVFPGGGIAYRVEACGVKGDFCVLIGVVRDLGDVIAHGYGAGAILRIARLV